MHSVPRSSPVIRALRQKLDRMALGAAAERKTLAFGIEAIDRNRQERPTCASRD
ncbi:hypothetical protein SSBR45G_19350 [Bradyrhizobium sp. SSBR45G]|nr:hypothetical protein SSBR45G_19350 [Bradyrhizobium sp. SSBR45G]GLH83785.1 hypothetical protein SSBR45R_12450 [Bradyrhizobium sp. SSBR45R]